MGSPRTGPSRDFAWWALVGVIILGATLRFAGLGTQSFWLDESFTRILVGKSFGGMLSALPHAENTPPLYYSIAWLWAHVVGSDEAGLRSLSAVFGTATLPVAYLLGRRVTSKRGAVLLAALVATSPFLVWYSQEARAYALVILLATLSILFTLQAAEDPTRRRLVAWSLTAGCAIATHYFAAFLIALEAVWLWREIAPRRGVVWALAPILAVAGGLAPLAIAQHGNGGGKVGNASLAGRVWKAAKESLVGQYGGPIRGLAPICALLLAGSLLLLARRASVEERRRLVVPLVLGGATVLLPLAIAAIGPDYFTTRYVSIAWIPLFVVPAAGFATTAGDRGVGFLLGGALAGAFLVVAVAVPLTPRLQRDDWRSAANSLGRPRFARAIVINPSVGFLPLSVYEPGTMAPPADRFPVREVDLVVMTRDGRQPPTLAPVPGFHVVARHKAASYVTARFVADRPREVILSSLVRTRLTPAPTGVVYEAAATPAAG